MGTNEKRRLTFGWILGICLVGTMLLGGCASTRYAPRAHWEQDTRGEEDTVLQRLAREIGGSGCILLDGKILYSWGRIDRPVDWASASKPVLSTLLFCALDRGVVRDADDRLVDYGVPLQGKDTTITFRSLGAMTSGYTLKEAAGEAYAYNDYGIQLYECALLEHVFRQSAEEATAEQFRPMQFEDEWGYYQVPPKRQRIMMSIRDYARFVWMWHNRGAWNEEQVITRKWFRKYMRPQVPYDLPHAAPCDRINDYLGIGSYGGGADHFTRLGPGVYGFNWWYNRPTPLKEGALLFPSLDDDWILSVGVRGHLSLFSPKRRYVLITSFGNWKDRQKGWGDYEPLLHTFVEHMDKTYVKGSSR